MNLNDLLSDNTAAPSFIAKEVDPEKHEKIIATLCEKRKALEEAVAMKGPEAEQSVISLLQLKNDMLLFGITEVQYVAYVESRKEKAPLPKPVNETITEMESLDSTG